MEEYSLRRESLVRVVDAIIEILIILERSINKIYNSYGL